VGAYKYNAEVCKFNKTKKKVVLMIIPSRDSKNVRYLPAVGLIADILLLIVHVSVLAECADINKGLAAVLVAAEEKDLCGGFRLGRLCLQHYGVFLGASVPILCTPVRKGVVVNHPLRISTNQP